MVVLTIVAQKNGETVYFEEPLPEVHFIRLLSCSLYNSWHNLERVGQISLKKTGDVLASLPQGHYNVESLAKELPTIKKIGPVDIKTEVETNKPNSVLTIRIETPAAVKEISVSHALASFLELASGG